MIQSYSVLMSVYHREQPLHLKQSLHSIWKQTLPSDDVVLVCDGPLTEQLYQVIEQAKIEMGASLKVVPLEKNVGLGKALNAGIQHCRHELIARMDTDDLAYPDRCQKQLAVFQAQPELGIVGAAVAEFVDNPEEVQTFRMPPETQAEIIRYAKSRCPFNHPCVMFRKQAVQDAGGYQDFYLLEDYYLWLRMLQHDVLGYNLQEPLLWMRISKEMFKRRGGWKYAKSLSRLYTYMLKSRFISFPHYLSLMFIRQSVALMPGKTREFIYVNALRRKTKA